MRDGLGLRWSFMGPFQTMELNAPGGLRDYAARYAGTAPGDRRRGPPTAGVERRGARPDRGRP